MEKTKMIVIAPENLQPDVEILEIDPVGEEIIWTKDITSLADVPVAMEANIRNIPVTIRGVGNEIVHNQIPGKTILRMVPHPDWVLVDGDLFKRSALRKAQVANIKPIMVEMLTTVLYNGGVVKPIHMDILHALLHLLMDRWERTGNRSGSITTTKAEIAEIISMQLNGRVRKQIDEALQTLSSLQVHKLFRGPKEGSAGHGKIGEIDHHMIGIISNYTVRHNAGDIDTRGPKPDLIDVEFNPEIVTAMTSGANHRQWALRTLNLSNTLKVTETWKRQLYRLLDSRMQQNGYLYMPLKELWIGCIGHEESDAFNPDRWRQARHRIRRVFEEFVQTGYVTDLEFPKVRRKLTDKHENSNITVVKETVNLTDGSKASVSFTAPYTLSNEDEWIRCTPGPAFNSQTPKRKREFALDLARVLTGNEVMDKLQDIDDDVLIDISNRRMKNVIAEIGDLHKRLPQVAWFDSSYPQATSNFLVRYFLAESRRKQDCFVRGIPYEQGSISYFCKRLEIVTAIMRKRWKAAGIDIAAVAAGTMEAPEEDAEVAVALQSAAKSVARDIDPTPQLFNPEYRESYPELEKSYQSVMRIACDVGFSAGVLTKWFGYIKREIKIQIEQYAEGDADEFYKNFWEQNLISITQKYPASAALVKELGRKLLNDTDSVTRKFEIIIGNRIRRRMMEAMFESMQLENVAAINQVPLVALAS